MAFIETVRNTRRETAAILFADVYRYSALMERDEERTYARVRRVVALLKRLAADYGGRVADVAGDGILVLFPDVGSALSLATAVQRDLSAEALWHPGEDPLIFRIGIHYGEVLLGEDGVFGHHVNVAKRVEEMASPGGICLTEEARATLGAVEGARTVPLGLRRLKNIAEPARLFSVDATGMRPHAEPDLPESRHTPFAVSDAAVAVLPFDTLGAEAGNRHLGDGLTVDIIDKLSRFRDLTVIARHSAFHCRDAGLGPEESGQFLGVRYLVTGTMQRADSRLRCSVHLAEVASGRLIWAERYQGDMGDIFAFQDDVADTVAARLALHISAAERRRVLQSRDPELHAYGLVLRGRELSLSFRREANLHARRLFEQAAELDPEYGRAYSGLSRTFNLSWRYRWAEKPDACLDLAVDLAHEAVRHDPADARGYSELGFASLYRRQHDAALSAYEKAIELNPNDADILAEMSDCLTYSGDPGRAVELLNRAMRLNPYCPDWYLWYLADAQFVLGDYEDTVRTLLKMRDQSEAHRMLAASYAHLGRKTEARLHAERVLQTHPQFSLEHWSKVPPFKNRAGLEPLVEGMRMAGLR